MSLLDDLRSKPIGPKVVNAPAQDVTTRSIEVNGDRLELQLPFPAGVTKQDAQGKALEYLVQEGQDPAAWEVTGFRKIQYGNPAQPMESVRFTYRRTKPTREPLPIDDLIRDAKRASKKRRTTFEADAYIVALADWQVGKIDGDGTAATVARVMRAIDEAADRIDNEGGSPHVLVAFVADLMEGFVSQGGANVWRVDLTLGEQVRIVRRLMMHALTRFTPVCDELTMACVPGNHDQPQRIASTGVTRYDDSHDVEALIAVHDAAQVNPEAFGHVEFLVPEDDSLTVVTDIAGLRVGMAHGHMFRNGDGHKWWAGQAYGNSHLRDAGLLITGHYHHHRVEASGPRLWVQVPSFESESTWFRNRTGVTGDPGLLLIEVQGGKVGSIRQVRGEG